MLRVELWYPLQTYYVFDAILRNTRIDSERISMTLCVNGSVKRVDIGDPVYLQEKLLDTGHKIS